MGWSVEMRFNQRDIVLIPFPYSDLSGTKQRPALIISNEVVNKDEDRICCLITSNPAMDGLEIYSPWFETGSLPFQSWIKPHRLFTIHEKIIKKKLCTINRTAHEKVIRAVEALIA